MNYLLHIYFCTPEPSTLTGACLGDFFKGKVENLPYAAELKQGIKLHRQLDSFADTHPLLLHSKSLFPPEQRRMSGIALDIFYDHFLAVHWSAYSTQALETFCQTFYVLAKKSLPLLPTEAQYFLNLIIRGDWLTSYRKPQNIALVLQRMSRHIPFQNTLGNCIQVLENKYEALLADFTAFMPAAQAQLPNNAGILQPLNALSNAEKIPGSATTEG